LFLYPNFCRQHIIYFGIKYILAGLNLHNLYSSPSIIRMIKSRRMRWAGHVVRMGRRGMYVGYWWEIHKERDDWEDQDVGLLLFFFPRCFHTWELAPAFGA
jgi:hypothetical protein